MDVTNVFIMPLRSFYQIRVWERKKNALLLYCGTAGKTYRALLNTFEVIFLSMSEEMNEINLSTKLMVETYLVET